MLTLISISLLIWIYLLGFHGGFWRADQKLSPMPKSMNAPPNWPDIVVIIPARDESETIQEVIKSHLMSDYPGRYEIILMDDHSTDNTAILAQETASQHAHLASLCVHTPPILPAGWTGKLWAQHHGILRAKKFAPKYFLLTDADIVHAPDTLRALVTKAEHENLKMVSLMARLDMRGPWGQMLIPAFIYFFMKLYPFTKINKPGNRLAGAAGGCMLVDAERLIETGGIEKIRSALIDDCALADQIKNTSPRSPIFLGLADKEVTSLRDNRHLSSIWDMVARTAYTQLDYSIIKLMTTLIGMVSVYLMAPLAVLTLHWHGSIMAAILGLITWGLMAYSFWPTLKTYNLSPLLTVTLPICGLFYSMMTLSSAIYHWQGKGGQWKGRNYS